MNLACVVDLCRSQYVRDDVERLVSFMHSGFENSGDGIEGRVNRSGSARAPASSNQIAAFSAVPGRCEFRLIEPPKDKVARPEDRKNQAFCTADVASR